MNEMGTVYLFSKRCILRRFERSDIYNVFNAYLSSPNIFKYLIESYHKTLYETEFMINNFINNYNNFNYYNWLIINNYNNEVIGNISIHSVDQYNECGEIGIIISEKYQKQGYAKECLNRVIDFAFNIVKFHRLQAKVLLENEASNKLFMNLGFKYETILHSVAKINNKFHDVNLYYLINI